MAAAGTPQSRLERFDACGADCVVDYSPSTDQLRLRANYCGDRFCVPCARARSGKVERAIVEKCRDIRPLFITGTLRADQIRLDSKLKQLMDSFARLRATNVWKRSIRGGAACVEIKRGAGSGQWHVHFHAICEGNYVDQRELSAAWARATGGSYIIDIRRSSDPVGNARYVAKYASKGWSHELVKSLGDLVECVVACRGRRLFITFGTWRKLDVDRPKTDPGDWKRVGRLVDIYAWAKEGQSRYATLWCHLTGRDAPELVVLEADASIIDAP